MKDKLAFAIAVTIDDFNQANKEWNRARKQHKVRLDIGHKYQDALLDAIINMNKQMEGTDDYNI